MFNPKNYEYDCTRKCRLIAHGNAITSALTKRSINNEKLAAYIAKTCCNFADIVDDLGHSAVHVAASVGRYEILEWLLNQGSIINGRDFESGSSPLHRAIFYGCIDCAVLLLRYGASPDILDEDSRSPLQHVCRLSDYSHNNSVNALNELLVWGSNKNYNLGINNDLGIDHLPQMLDYFRKEQISIQMASLGAYHSLFLDNKSNLYAVGHGKGGRLGTGNENSLSTPKKVKIHSKHGREEIICISVSRNHSLVLTINSLVFACGLNDSQQLGIRDAGEKCLNFKEVITLRNFMVQGLQEVIAKDNYSLAYSDKCLYVWGANTGQMGFDANTKIVQLPQLMKLPYYTSIQFVDANNTATAVLTRDNTILLYHNYKMKCLKAPYFESVKSIAVIGGDTTKTERGSASALKLLILTQTNVVFLWYQLTQHFYRCSFSNIRLTQIDKILYKANQLVILSEGDIYKGKCQQIVVQPHSDNNAKIGGASKYIWSVGDHRPAEVAKDYLIRIDLQHITQIDRAVDVFCDEDFASFAVLQESHAKYFKLPVLKSEEYKFKKLYNNVCEDDTIHDVVFHVDGEKFPAHRFIVYARAPGLRELIISKDEKDIHLSFEHITGKTFALILKCIYLNYLPNAQDIQSSFHNDSAAELKNAYTIFLNFVEQCRITTLIKYLKSDFYYRYIEGTPFHLLTEYDESRYRFSRLHHTDYPQLYDVRIVCENNEELLAHKCVLVERLEYFEMMFTHSWAEQSEINLSTVPLEYMQAIIEFVYSLNTEHFVRQKHRETFLYNIIVFCDQFFFGSLKKVCETLLLEKLSIRKCSDMLEFACMYNCELLKKGCLDYICHNLARILHQKSLFNCEPEVLKCINEHYRKMFKKVFDYRIITPNSQAIDDECLYSFVEDFKVDLNYRMDEEQQVLYRSAQKTKPKESKSKLSVRQYERDAITSMMETLNVSENTEKERKNSEKSYVVKEAEEMAEKIQNEAKSWMKVVDKKDHKKKLSLEQAIKANEVIKQEEPPSPNYVNLTKANEIFTPTKSKTPERDSEEFSSTSTASKLYNINLADLTTPVREKLSQKQRKRLSSESPNSLSSWRAPSSQEAKPVALQSTPTNVWATVSQPLTAISQHDTMNSPPTGSSGDPSSFANMMRSNTRTSTALPAASSSSNNSFSQILAEEKRQREHYERTKHKSLALTQIEEQAIAELNEFYNVNNVTDEIITIQRKSIQPTINFVVWQRN